MRRLAVIIGFIAATVVPSLSSGANEPPPRVPTAIEHHYPEHFLQTSGEPTLWTVDARNGYKDRIRLSIHGIARLAVIVRIDELEGGKIIGRAILSNHGQTGSRRRIVNFRISPSEMAELRGLFGPATLWSRYLQIYGMRDENDICVDGEEMAFERVNADGYRFASANAQCTAPAELLAVARKIIELAGVKRALRLLD